MVEISDIAFAHSITDPVFVDMLSALSKAAIAAKDRDWLKASASSNHKDNEDTVNYELWRNDDKPNQTTLRVTIEKNGANIPFASEASQGRTCLLTYNSATPDLLVDFPSTITVTSSHNGFTRLFEGSIELEGNKSVLKYNVKSNLRIYDGRSIKLPENLLPDILQGNTNAINAFIDKANQPPGRSLAGQ